MSVMSSATCSDTLYLAGYFTTQAIMGTTTLSSQGAEDIFVAALRVSDGAVHWAISGGGVNTDEGRAITCDNSTGKVYVTGGFTDSMTFSSTDSTIKTAIAQSKDVFIASITSGSLAVDWFGVMCLTVTCRGSGRETGKRWWRR